MSDQSAAAPTPAALLSELTELRKRARADRHAYSFPLVLFGLLILAAAPLYLVPAGSVSAWTPNGPTLTSLGGDFLPHATALGWYWLAALVAGYLSSLWWYRRHASRVGVATPMRGYLVAGAAGTVGALLLSVVLERILRGGVIFLSSGAPWVTVPLLGVGGRGMFPHLVIGLGLAVLARLERSRFLAIVVGCYGAVVVLVNAYFHLIDADTGVNRFSFLIAATLPAFVLLLGAALAPRKKDA